MKKTLILTALLLAACSSEKASFETQEQARKRAIENAEFNAKSWRAKNPIYQQHGLISDGDSSITPTCPQGDGWATLELVSPRGKRTKIKCSTVSASIGCMEATKFKTKAYAEQDGTCNKDIPFPLPKIVK